MAFNPDHVNLSTGNKEDVLCYFALSENDYNGHLGARISSVFVILFVSSAFTVFPVLAERFPSWRIPLGMYLLARYFGTGVVVATAFVHLLDPAYKRIGLKTCVGESGYWAEYSWCADVVLGSVVIIFLLDLAAEVYVEHKYGVHKDEEATNFFINQGHHSSDQAAAITSNNKNEKRTETWASDGSPATTERSFRQQVATFLLLEFGIIFHSAIIGLNLRVTDSEFSTLYFHQSFEDLGIGMRMSAIPFGVRNTHTPGSKVSLIIQGVLNAVSTGILIYRGLVELLARDFLFDPCQTKRRSKLLFMVCCTLLALIGKWAWWAGRGLYEDGT